MESHYDKFVFFIFVEILKKVYKHKIFISRPDIILIIFIWM
jgi:hypothetical protein